MENGMISEMRYREVGNGMIFEMGYREMEIFNKGNANYSEYK